MRAVNTVAIAAVIAFVAAVLFLIWYASNTIGQYASQTTTANVHGTSALLFNGRCTINLTTNDSCTIVPSLDRISTFSNFTMYLYSYPINSTGNATVTIYNATGSQVYNSTFPLTRLSNTPPTWYIDNTISFNASGSASNLSVHVSVRPDDGQAIRSMGVQATSQAQCSGTQC